MAVKDYREMLIASIITLAKKGEHKEITRAFLSNLSFDELNELANKLQAKQRGYKMINSKKSVNYYFAFFDPQALSQRKVIVHTFSLN